LRGSLPKSRSEKEVKMANGGGTSLATETVIIAAAR